MKSTAVVVCSLWLLSCLVAAGEKEKLKTIQARGCEQDMSCEREAVDPDMFESVSATSTLKGSRKHPGRYAAAMAVDDKEQTAWCEGKRKSGLGERLTIKLVKPVTIDGVLVSPLFAKSVSVGENNNRITTYILDFGVKAFRVKSEDFIKNVCGPPPNDCTELNAPQQVRFPPLTTDTVTLTIEQVVRGKKYNDTCVSTMRLMKPDLE